MINRKDSLGPGVTGSEYRAPPVYAGVVFSTSSAPAMWQRFGNSTPFEAAGWVAQTTIGFMFRVVKILRQLETQLGPT